MKYFVLAAALALGACNVADAPTSTDKQPGDPVKSDNAARPVSQLTADGWGKLVIGMTGKQVVDTVGREADPDTARGTDTQSCEMFHPRNAPDGMRVMIEDGTLSRITLTGNAAIETEHGFKIGANGQNVKLANGYQAVVTPHKYAEAPAEYITIWKTGVTPGQGGYVKDPNARGIRYEVGNDGRVEAIHVGGPSIQYVEGCL